MTENSPEILVYVDPSQRGEWAIGAAAQLVPALFTRLVLLATVDDVKDDPALLSRAKEAFAGKAREIREVVRPGPAERAVKEECERSRFALVVVPPAGRKAIARLLKGSRVATVVRQVKSSVLVARRPPPRFRRIVLAVGGGVHSLATALGAIEVAKALSAELEVLHVDSSVELPAELPWVEKRIPNPAITARSERETTLEGVKEALAANGFTRPLRLRRGMIVNEVLAEIEEHADDLLVLGAHRAAGAETWMLDDVTEQILLSSPISILVIRAPEPAPGSPILVAQVS